MRNALLTIWVEPDVDAMPTSVPCSLFVCFFHNERIMNFFHAIYEYVRVRCYLWFWTTIIDRQSLRRADMSAEPITTFCRNIRKLSSHLHSKLQSYTQYWYIKKKVFWFKQSRFSQINGNTSSVLSTLYRHTLAHRHITVPTKRSVILSNGIYPRWHQRIGKKKMNTHAHANTDIQHMQDTWMNTNIFFFFLLHVSDMNNFVKV